MAKKTAFGQFHSSRELVFSLTSTFLCAGKGTESGQSIVRKARDFCETKIDCSQAHSHADLSLPSRL